MKKLILMILITLIGSVYANHDDCYKAYSKQNYKLALSNCMISANSGDASSQLILGIIYYQGLGGVEQNYKLALKWYKKAADQGYDPAENIIGSMYYQGHGVKQDYQQAYNWYKRAADHGNTNAQDAIYSFPHLKQYVQEDNQDLSNKYNGRKDSVDKVDGAEDSVTDKDGQKAQTLDPLKEFFADYSPLKTFFWYVITIILIVTTTSLCIKFINRITKLSQEVNIVDKRYIPKTCKWCAISILVLSIVNIYIYILADAVNEFYYILCLLLTLIIIINYTILYSKLDKTFNTRLNRIYWLRICLGLIYVVLCGTAFLFIARLIAGAYNASVFYLAINIIALIIITFVALISLSVIFYKIGSNYKIIGKYTNNQLFSYSGKSMQVGTYLAPVLIGFFIIGFSGIIFLIACAINESSKFIAVEKNE
ncbi:MAG: hypothetical protein ACK5Z5_07085 [Neisseriaceae bacterium]